MIELFPAPVLPEQSVTKGVFEPEHIHSPSDDTDLLAGPDGHTQSPEDSGELGAVFHDHVAHFHLSLRRPWSRRFLVGDLMGRLLLELLRVVNLAQRVLDQLGRS